MNPIDSNILGRLGLTQPSKPVGPRAIDPTPRLRIVDRQDSVELRSVPAAQPAPSASAAKPVASIGAVGETTPPAAPDRVSRAAATMAERLVAGTVSTPAVRSVLSVPASPSFDAEVMDGSGALAGPSASPSVAGGQAMRMYQNPSDQNAAATRGRAGSLLDIEA